MIQINSTSNSKYFEMNGVEYPRIYQPIAMGSSGIGIISIYNSMQILTSTSYTEISINGVIKTNQEDAIKSIIDLTYDVASSDEVTSLDVRVDNLEENQYTGVIVYSTFAELPVVGVVNTSYKVTNDVNAQLNGYYSWSGSAYIKEAEVNDVVFSSSLQGLSQYSDANKIYLVTSDTRKENNGYYQWNGFEMKKTTSFNIDKYTVSGVNEIDIQSANKGQILTSTQEVIEGVIYDGTTPWIGITDYIKVLKEQLYRIVNPVYGYGFAVYDADKNLIEVLSSSELFYSSNYEYVRIGVGAGITSLIMGLAVQSSEVSLISDQVKDQAVISNIEDSVAMLVTEEKNVYDQSLSVEGHAVGVDNKLFPISGFSASDYMQISDRNTWYMHGGKAAGTAYHLFFNSEGVIIGVSQVNSGLLTLPATTSFMRATFDPAIADTGVTSTSDFIPYGQISKKASIGEQVANYYESPVYEVSGQSNFSPTPVIVHNFIMSRVSDLYASGDSIRVRGSFKTDNIQLVGNNLNVWMSVRESGNKTIPAFDVLKTIETIEGGVWMVFDFIYSLKAESSTFLNANKQAGIAIGVAPSSTDLFVNARYEVKDLRIDLGSRSTDIVKAIEGSTNNYTKYSQSKAISGEFGSPSFNLWNELSPSGENAVKARDNGVRGETPLTYKQLLMLGDSITDGKNGGYVKYVARDTGARICNAGDSGATVQDTWATVNGFSTGVGDATFPTLDYTDIDVITIQIGTNLGLGGTLDALPAESAYDIPFTTSGGVYVDTIEKYWDLFGTSNIEVYAKILEFLNYQNDSVKIFIITPPIIDQEGRGEEMRQQCKELANHYYVEFVDAIGESGMSAKWVMHYTSDGVHLNEKGNEIWGKYIARKITT